MLLMISLCSWHTIINLISRTILRRLHVCVERPIANDGWTNSRWRHQRVHIYRNLLSCPLCPSFFNILIDLPPVSLLWIPHFRVVLVAIFLVILLVFTRFYLFLMSIVRYDARFFVSEKSPPFSVYFVSFSAFFFFILSLLHNFRCSITFVFHCFLVHCPLSIFSQQYAKHQNLIDP